MRSETESEVIQSCLTLCDTMDFSLPGSSIHGIFQARVLEWVAFPSSEDFRNPEIEPGSPMLQADPFPSEQRRKPIHKDNTIHKDKLKMD